MATPSTTTAGTVAPQGHAGLPQMDFTTFPSQIFWLVVTFGLLFVVLSRVTLPRIASTITTRRNRIEGDLATAERSRKDAADALAAYETALAQARARAMALAEENRKGVTREIERLKHAADEKAQDALVLAEKRIAAERAKATEGLRTSAAEAAAAIVTRLTGVPVSAADATRAVESLQVECG
jgi:F-type H+-transporting ATPase subunit b